MRQRYEMSRRSTGTTASRRQYAKIEVPSSPFFFFFSMQTEVR